MSAMRTTLPFLAIVSSLKEVSADGHTSMPKAEIALSSANVHWGYFSKELEPVLTVASGTEVVVEMATHHACDDWDKMIKGDPGMEDVFSWDQTGKLEDFRGATGGGDGVHVLSGPIYVEEAEPGDILKVEIMDLMPRPNAEGKTYGSNAAAWWGFQARVNKADGTPFLAGTFTSTPGENDEVITIYEIMDENGQGFAVPVYQFEWPDITDPQGEHRDFIAYPGTCVPHDVHGDTTPSSEVADMGWTKDGDITYMDDVYKAKIPINYHVGCMGLAPESHSYVDSIPPMPTGGNLDNKRIGIGTTMYYPVEVAGALLSMGDAHAAQGDSELDGTGIETSITGKFKISVIKAADFTPAQAVMDFPLGETESEWIVHGFTETDYLETYADNPGDIYGASSIDKAMKNAFTQTRKFVMAEYGLTDAEATTIITQGVDFGMTQLVDGNWGVHGIIPKIIFSGGADINPDLVVSPKMAKPEADIALSSANVHWGYFSKELEPVLTVASGTEVVVEMATHHACDDWDKMIKGDPGMEDVFSWDQTGKLEDFRGATGGGDGVHVLSGPIYVKEAEPGDILKVEIMDLMPRPNAEGKTYGSNAAAWWGFQARVNNADGTPFLAGTFTSTPGENDEVITIYEIMDENGQGFAVPVYQFEWPDITDPQGEHRDFIAYPGTCVPHDVHGDTTPSSEVADMGWTKDGDITYMDDVYKAKIPINYHVGCMGLAPESHSYVDSIPPMPTGGNLDNKRIGIGTTMYYPVEVAGALLSMGDAHAAQGDSELDGTGIETSITGKFKISVIKAADFTPAQAVMDFPLGETESEWIVHGFTETDYLETYADNPGDIYGASSIDKAMKNAFTQTRKFVMAEYGLTDAEATTIITQGVDFGMTQLVDGNWGVHGIIPKIIFSGEAKMDDTGPGPSTMDDSSGAGMHGTSSLVGFGFVNCLASYLFSMLF